MSNQTTSFVRTEMLPEQEPPLTEKGAVKWARENLFATWVDAALTLIALFVIYTVLVTLIPWIFGGVWKAGSLAECRAVLEAWGKGSHDGACWAVINERWLQFLFGFYPSDLYWRPIIIFALLFVALAPVLFAERVPGQLMWFTAAYPFLATWLLWGGSFWVPIFAVLGFVAGYVAYRLVVDRVGGTLASLAALLGAVVWWGVISPAVSNGLHQAVANARFADAQTSLPAEITAIETRIEELELQGESLETQITAALGEVGELQEEIVFLRETDGDVSAPLATFDAARDELAALRGVDDGLSTELAILREERSALRLLNTRVSSLEEIEARLPEREALAAELRSNLPDSVARLQIAENLPDDIPEGDVALLEAALDAESDAVNDAISLRATYDELGLVGLQPVSSSQFGGFLLVFVIGVAGIVLSLPLGILLALGRQSDLFIINKVSVFFIEVIRGVPLIVWLFTASLLLNYFLPPGTNFDIMLRVIIMVTLFSSAYIAEVIRGGLAALPRGQYEAADALGLDYGKAMRLIILPQALKISIPGIVNTFIGLFKDTTLVVFVGLFDPLKGMADTIRADQNWIGIYWEVFIFPGVLFFIFCYSMGRYSNHLEKKLRREHR